MPIGLNDLDPTVAQAFGECLRSISPSALSGGIDTPGSGLTAETDSGGSQEGGSRAKELSADQKNLRKVLTSHRWLGGGWTNFLPVGAAFACVMAGSNFESQPWIMSTLFGLSFLFSGGGLWHMLRKDLLVEFRVDLPHEVLSAAIPQMNLSPVEHVYAEGVALLAALQEKVADQTARNMLLRLNEMVVNHRQLETQRLRLSAALKQHSAEDLDADHARLTKELEVTDDSVTRNAIEQSLQMCEARMQDARSMAQNMHRVAAQEEAIRQTLASAQSALLRMQTTPALTSSAVEEITRAVSEINQQTVAVEEAVQEVELRL